MKTRIFIILIFLSIQVIGQEKDDILNNFEYPVYLKESVKKNDFTSKYLSYNFSALLTPKRDFLGYIGKKYRRIHIYYTSISKDSISQKKYFVEGKSLVGNNVCDFKGEIQIEQIREYKSIDFGVDNMYENEGYKAQGILIGKYKFKEDPEQNHSGIFEGLMAFYWYVDKYGIVHYDRINWNSDSFRNNQYVGEWTEYGKRIGKTCNWGEYRIPFSGDLDIGAGGFSPNSKYKDMGWKPIGE